MTQKADSFDLGTLRLSSGEARAVELTVPIDELTFGSQRYTAGDGADARLDISHTTTGHALRLRFEVSLSGPCARCLEGAVHLVPVDAREVDQPGTGEELESPYIEDGVVDLAAWARDALVLSLPVQIVCREDCKGLCGVCGENLNEHPDHAHEPEPDPRWAKLAELKFDE